jgi:hypothetical protein
MMDWLIRRLRRDEDGYAIVIAMILMAIMMVSLVVALNAGNAALRESDFGVKWARTLAVAESGIDDAITTLIQDRTAASDCAIGSASACSMDDAEYQVSWVTNGDGSVTVTSTGAYPTVDDAKYTRTIEVLLEPAPSFQYALFAEDDLEVKNNQVITGSIYSSGNITIQNNTTVCGSIVSGQGNIEMALNTETLTDHVATGCSGEEADLWAGGSILLDATTQVGGDAKASAPTGTACDATSTSYQIEDGTVAGTATACGRVTATAGTSLPGTSTTPPTVETLPTFTFAEVNYPGLVCYGGAGACTETNTSATAVDDFNTFKSLNAASMSGTYAIWQESPSSATVLDLESITLGGDLTIITNAPIDFGNTATIGSVGGIAAELVVVSTYIPPAGSSCTTNGGDCSIYSKNAIVFDNGDDDDLTDGVAGLVYTPGKMAVKNSGSAADGALYAGTMDIKNGFEIIYNSRISRILGFGTGLEPTLWQELSD